MEGVQQMLRKLVSQISDEQNYEDPSIKVKPVSSGGANYTSTLYTATVSSPNKDDLELFAKVAALSEKCRETISGLIYDIERFVYENLMKEFERIEDDCNVPKEDRFVVTKVYAFNKNFCEETIVMENLIVKGYTTYDRLKSIDWDYASKAAETLARFHALSMAYEERFPEECKALYDKFDNIIKPAYKNVTNNFPNCLDIALAKLNGESRERLAKYFEDENKHDIYYFTDLRRKTALVHGDYRPSNLMHKVNKDGSIDIIPLDFQTMQSGCMLGDLMYLIFTGSDETFRAQYFEKLVQFYYDQLCRSMRLLRLNPDKIYPREDFEYELKEVLPYGLVCGVMFLPVVTVDSEDAIDQTDDEMYNSIFKTKTSPLYISRINGLIEDYVRWGVI